MIKGDVAPAVVKLVKVVLQSLSCVWLYMTPWTAAHQASLSFTISQSWLKLMSFESMMPSNHLIFCRPFSSCPQSFPLSGSFLMSQLFTSGGQSIGASASASVLLMNILIWWKISVGIDWFDLLAVQGILESFLQYHSSKHQLFGSQPSFWFKSHICTWPLEKPLLWQYIHLSSKWHLCFLICCLGLS